MTSLMALSIVTGLLCGIWSQFAPVIGLIGWAGFAGCTTYFASNSHGIEGFIVTVRQNLLGVACGMAIIYLGNMFPELPMGPLVFSGFVTFVMCIMGKFEWFSFIPGTFVGSFSAFAANGNWQVLVPSLILGAVLGVACDLGGAWFHTFFDRVEE